MDQELIAFLNEHFRDVSRQIAGLREETTQQIASLREETNRHFTRIDARFEQVDARFEQVDARFEQVDARFEQVDARFEQVNERFERVEATARQTVVLIEGLRHEVHLIAEAFLGVGDKLDLYRNESRLSIDDVKGWMEVPFRELDNRIRYLEGPKERRYEDVMDEVRRSLGKPPLGSPVASD